MHGGTRRVAEALRIEPLASQRALLALALRYGDPDVAATALREAVVRESDPEARAAAEENLWLLDHPGLCRRRSSTPKESGVQCSFSCRQGWFKETHKLSCPDSAVPPWLRAR
jgi:hypothetical protein